MKRNVVVIISVVVVVGLVIVWAVPSGTSQQSGALMSEVKEGRFTVPVRTTGELEAKESVEIRGPEGLRNRSLGLREIKILDLVDEGTLVDSGDYVARLDKTEALSKLKDIEDELEKRKSEYITTKLDTAMELKKHNQDDVQAEMSTMMEQMKNNPNISKEQRKRMREQMEQAMAGMKAMADAPEADIKAVRPYRDRIRQAMND